MKRSARSSLQALQDRLVLTAAEKRIVLFIVAAIALGLATRHYRGTITEGKSSQATLLVSKVNDSPKPKRKTSHRKMVKDAASETSSDANDVSDD